MARAGRRVGSFPMNGGLGMMNGERGPIITFMVHPRRSFLTLAGLSLPAFAQTLKENATDEAALWRFVQKQFPLESELIYMNAANVTPAALPVLDRQSKLLADFEANPSFQNREKFKPMYETVRGKLATLLGAAPDEIALTRNTSEATNTIVQGLDLKAGDEIVITDHNHPSNLDSWQMRAKRQGLVVRVAQTPDALRSADDLAAPIEKLVNPKTRVISITHLTSTTGLLFPVDRVVALARRNGAWMHLDGAQTLGAVAMNLHALGVDSYSGSAHKWIMGPLEAGMLYVRQERLPQVWPAIVTAGWSDELKGARKLDVFGQRDDARIAAFDATLDFVNTLGVPRIERRIRQLAAYLRRSMGREVHGSSDAALCFSVVKMRPQKKTPQQVYDLLWQHHRIATSVTGTGRWAGVRFSPHIYNSFEQVDEIAAAIRKHDA